MTNFATEAQAIAANATELDTVLGRPILGYNSKDKLILGADPSERSNASQSAYNIIGGAGSTAELGYYRSPTTGFLYAFGRNPDASNFDPEIEISDPLAPDNYLLLGNYSEMTYDQSIAHFYRRDDFDGQIVVRHRHRYLLTGSATGVEAQTFPAHNDVVNEVNNGWEYLGAVGGIAPAAPNPVVVGDIYVDVSVAASGSGAQESPFKTIQEAASIATAGQVISIAAGVYYEQNGVAPANSGSVNNRIKFAGQFATDGTPLVKIIGGENTASWTLDASFNEGVYTTTDIAYSPEVMILDESKDIPRLGHTGGAYDMLNYIDRPDPYMHSLFQYASAIPDVNYWDGLGALFGYNNGVTYLRFRDNSDPNAKDIRYNSAGGGFNLEDRSYVTVSGVDVAGFEFGVIMTGADSHHNIVENTDMSTGAARVLIEYGAHSNVIRNNEFYMGLLEPQHRPGAWSGGDVVEPLAHISGNIYQAFKHEVGRSTFSANDDSCVALRHNPGADNEIYGNHMHDTLTAVYIFNGVRVKIHDNQIDHCSSSSITVAFNSTDIEIYDNEFEHNNFQMRIQEMQMADPKLIYIYRNKFWNPEKAGSSHIFLHYSGTATNQAGKEVWIYHNSFAGSRRPYSGTSSQIDHTPTRLVNNILSSATGVLDYNHSLGLFAYNWQGGFFQNPTASWHHASNILEQTAFPEPIAQVWPVSVTDTMAPDYVVPSGHVVEEAGIDLSGDFTIDGITYPALPGMDTGYFAGSAPTMGARP